ncbi:MAG: Dicarboxylate carrier MatC domain protein [Geminicoccaceae bacterium]|nr:Dicarboxylate carrier MatC domain protein [Geminicoccaceae bacterium]
MSPAVASLIALLVAIAVSLTSRVNVGVLAMVFAWIIGTTLAGLRPEQVATGFPSSLFLTLTGVTLLFALAETNGTLERLANRAILLARGNARAIPLVFFAIAFVLSSIGPGAISTVALLIPLAMAIGMRAGISPFLTALMIANGANAGNLSPISAVGVVANSKMAEAGIGPYPGKVWIANLVAHALVAAAAYVLLGGYRLHGSGATGDGAAPVTALDRRHWLTIGVVSIWIVGVVGFTLNVGMAAFAAAVLLVLARVADEQSGVRRVPWGVIVMVCGVTVLIALLERTGGMELFTSMLATLASPATVNGMVAFVTGLISSWSSTVGVVLPVFLPAVPSLVTKVGGGDPLAVALSINVGGSMVDVSPLSTLGALCVAAVGDPAQARTLFRQLLIWGLSMSVVGAVLCQALAGVLARA